MLQSELPRARIMTYGYNANVALNTNQGDLRDQAQMFLNRLLHKRDTVRYGGPRFYERFCSLREDRSHDRNALLSLLDTVSAAL